MERSYERRWEIYFQRRVIEYPPLVLLTDIKFDSDLDMCDIKMHSGFSTGLRLFQQLNPLLV